MENIGILAKDLKFPEGPVFDPDGCLWCVEQEGEGLFCRDKDGSTMRIHTGGRPNGAVIHDGYLWFCDSGQNAVRRLNLDSKRIETVLDTVAGQPLNMPNDLLFDDRGNLIFTCPGPPEANTRGYVAVHPTKGPAEIIADELTYPNGMAFFPNKQSLLVAETHKQRIWQGYWDSESMTWENIRVWATTSFELDNAPIPGPDGMTVGPDGNLYVAIFGSGIIKVYSADEQFVRDIRLPGQNPSNCVFDPSGQLGLVVTETERGELVSVTW